MDSVRVMASTPTSDAGGSAWEVLRVFLRLGCLSFGGPVAHVGYFHTEFVERRKWCDEESFASLVGLAQAVPGPASSQVGFGLGLLRAGWMGGVAAWIGFTTPSALLMLAFAFGHRFMVGKTGTGVVHGLQLVAVAVVAQAILAMRKSLAPDGARMGIALVAAAIVFWASPGSGTVLAIAAGALLGLLLRRPPQEEAVKQLRLAVPKRAGVLAGAMFVLLLAVLPVATRFVSGAGGGEGGGFRSFPAQGVAVFSAFYRTGALVFGGGHVVLPLLEGAVVARGWSDQASFLAGYGAAQAVPGPLFTFAAYLGATIQPALHPAALGVLALLAIFLPGVLIIVAVLPFWNELRQRRQIQAMFRGVNAAVVGVLISAFIRPVWVSAIHSPFDLAVALAAFALLVGWKVPPWIIVVGVAGVSAMAAVV